MQDFLTFQTFITPTLLLLMYYVGAVLIPLLSWTLARWIKRSYFSELSGIVKEEIHSGTTSKQRFLLLLAFLLSFLAMEILWRVIFEFFIAYFDMHDALMQLNANK